MTGARIVRALRTAWPAVAAVLALALVTLYGAAGSEVLQRTIGDMLINVVLVVGLYVFVGNSGVFSFGHVSFMAMGAYVAGLLTIPAVTKGLLIDGMPQWLVDAHAGPFVAIVAGALFAALVAGLLGVPLMRLGGISASLAMFAVLITVNVVASNWTQVTGGTGGLANIPPAIGLGEAFAFAALAAIAAFAFQRTALGLRLRATREDDVAAQSIGIGVFNERRAAFVLSGFVTGVGGGMFAEWNGAFTPDAFYLSITFLLIAMLVVGGMQSLTGAVLGVLVLTLVSEVLRNIEDGAQIGPVSIAERPGLREVGLALVMLAILLFRPSGITGGREIPWPADAVRALRRRRSGGRD